MDIGLFPGMKASQLGGILKLNDVRGIVLRTFGTGNAPGYPDFLDTIASAANTDAKESKTILNITSCPQGIVEMGLYAASSGLLERGVISGLDMTPEAALAKMMFVLQNFRGEDIQLELQQNRQGEQSESLYDVRYGAKGMSSEPQGLHTVSQRPPGPFQKSLLKRAVLRVSGVGFSDAKEGDIVKVRIFLNLPDADENTRLEGESSFAGELSAIYLGPSRTILLKDVTEAIQNVYDDGRPLYVTLVPLDGRRIWYRGLFVSLFAKAA